MTREECLTLLVAVYGNMTTPEAALQKLLEETDIAEDYDDAEEDSAIIEEEVEEYDEDILDEDKMYDPEKDSLSEDK